MNFCNRTENFCNRTENSYPLLTVLKIIYTVQRMLDSSESYFLIIVVRVIIVVFQGSISNSVKVYTNLLTLPCDFSAPGVSRRYGLQVLEMRQNDELSMEGNIKRV